MNQTTISLPPLRLVHFTVEVFEFPMHERARVLNRLIVDLRPQSAQEEVEDLLRSEGADVLIELLQG